VCQKTKIHGYHIVHIWFSAGFLVNFKGENLTKDASCKNHKYLNHAKVPSFKKVVGIDPLISLVGMFWEQQEQQRAK